MREIKAIIKPERLSEVLRALHAIPELPGVTVSTVRGYGRRVPAGETTFDEVERIKLEIVVTAPLVAPVVEAVRRAAHTGLAGDGKIFVLPVEHAVNIRSGEHDHAAL